MSDEFKTCRTCLHFSRDILGLTEDVGLCSRSMHKIRRTLATFRCRMWEPQRWVRRDQWRVVEGGKA